MFRTHTPALPLGFGGGERYTTKNTTDTQLQPRFNDWNRSGIKKHTLRDGASSGEDNPTPEALPRSYTHMKEILIKLCFDIKEKIRHDSELCNKDGIEECVCTLSSSNRAYKETIYMINKIIREL